MNLYRRTTRSFCILNVALLSIMLLHLGEEKGKDTSDHNICEMRHINLRKSPNSAGVSDRRIDNDHMPVTPHC